MLSGKVASCYTIQDTKSISGWSLLELLCVLALMAIAGHVWVPTWQQAMDKLSLQQYQHGMLQQLRQSRAWAQQHEQAVTLVGWANDARSVHLLAFIDDNNDRSWQAHERLITRQQYPIALFFSRGDYVRFSKLGTTGQSGSWHLCHINLDQGWKLILSSSGNLRVEEFDCRG